MRLSQVSSLKFNTTNLVGIDIFHFLVITVVFLTDALLDGAANVFLTQDGLG